jgi:SAM-dependent methyltransferase
VSGVPATWLVEHQHLLPRSGTALDVACGRGRHSLWLAERGLVVHAIDNNADAVDGLARIASARSLSVRSRVLDLEGGSAQLPERAFDLVVVFNYLHRPLFPALVGALRPRGLLIYETFTRAQAARGKPTNPAFLLQPGELRRLVEPLEVVAEREGTFEDRDIASIVAVAPLD